VGLRRQAENRWPASMRCIGGAGWGTPRTWVAIRARREIRGTAVAGATQRGGDFLPLQTLPGENWGGAGAASERPTRSSSRCPVDLVQVRRRLGVMDGHNRVAAALYSNGVGLDAMVTNCPA